MYIQVQYSFFSLLSLALALVTRMHNCWAPGLSVLYRYYTMGDFSTNLLTTRWASSLTFLTSIIIPIDVIIDCFHSNPLRFSFPSFQFSGFKNNAGGVFAVWAAPTGAPAPIGTFPLFSVIVWIIQKAFNWNGNSLFVGFYFKPLRKCLFFLLCDTNTQGQVIFKSAIPK